MKTETKTCQNCKKDFVIEQEDFNFYEKMKVPAPTFCPSCRFERRLSFMNIYSLYKRNCDKCKEPIISMFHKDKKETVFCSKCWWGDSWDGTEYAMDYDENRNFFEQLLELKNKTPYMALDTLYSSLINASYTNYSSHLKNCYALFFADYAENCFYSEFLNTLKDTADCHRIRESELCYGSVGIFKGYRNIFSQECDSCVDVFFSRDCSGCIDCFGCINLKKKSYCIYNVQHSKEEYFEFIKKVNLSSFSNIEKYQKEATSFWLTQPHRSSYGNSFNVNVSGNYVYESKNTKDSYLVTSTEDSRYVQMTSVPYSKDCYDYTCWGGNVEKVYETLIAGHDSYNIKFSVGSYPECVNNEYCYYASTCENVFGCINLKRKKYCILNKEYSKEEYQILREKIIKNMNENIFMDSNNKEYKYGEFFPTEFSSFSYNETIANQYFPKTKEEAEKQKIKWFDAIPNEYTATIKSDQLPDELIDSENILDEVIECSCGRCYKISEGELNILKKINIAIPRKCPLCRRMERFDKVLPPTLCDRVCAKCDTQIKTSYASNRLEIIYCDKCYQEEVY